MPAEFIPSVSISDYLNYENAREHICIRVVNYDNNRDFIEDLPHVVHCDLAVIFYYMPPTDPELPKEQEADPCDQTLSASHQIVETDLENWGITVEQLYQDAVRTSREIHPAFLAPMRQVLGLSGKPDDGEIPMYVLSCRDARYGASALFYPEVLQAIAAGLQDGLFIIPSSVHELILLREQDVDDTSGLSRMIREINRSEVLPGDVLSDHLYHYDREQDLLRRVADDFPQT